MFAAMLATDEDAVICDLAETYHVLDYRALDLSLAATLAAGLAPDSRIMRKLSGAKLPTATTLLAAAVDNLATIRWYLSDDGPKGVNRPLSVLAALSGAPDPAPSNVRTYGSVAEFEAARALILEGVNNGD